MSISTQIIRNCVAGVLILFPVIKHVFNIQWIDDNDYIHVMIIVCFLGIVRIMNKMDKKEKQSLIFEFIMASDISRTRQSRRNIL